MAFDYLGAIKDGYTESEINDYLAGKHNFDINAARKDGVDERDIRQHLMAKSTPKVETPKQQKGPKVLDENDTSSDFLRGLGNTPGSIEETYGAAKALTGLAAKKLGADQFGQEVIKSGLEHMESGKANQTVRKTDDFEEAWHKGIGAVVTDWLPYQMGAGVGNLAEAGAFSLAGAGLGAVTGAGVGAVPGAVAGALSRKLVERGIETAAKEVLEKTIAEQVASGATKEFAKDAGKAAAKAFTEEQGKKILTEQALASAYKSSAARGIGTDVGQIAQAGMHGAGEVMGRVLDEADKNGTDINDINLGRVLPAALVHAVGDYINERVGLGALKIGEGTSKHLVTEILKRVAVTGAKETGGEEIQTIAERLGANLSLTDADAISDYVNTAAASFGMAVIPSGVGGYRAQANAKQNVIDANKTQEQNSDIQQDTQKDKDTAKELQGTLDPNHLNILKPAVDDKGNPLADMSDATTEGLKNAGSTANLSINQVAATNPNATTDFQEDKDNPLKKGEVNLGLDDLNKKLDDLNARTSFRDTKHEVNVKKQIERLTAKRDHLQGVANAEQTNGQTSGTSTEVVQPADQGQPATGAAGPDTNGVVSPGQDAGVPNDGAITKPPAVKKSTEPSVKLQTKINRLSDQIDELRDAGISDTNSRLAKLVKDRDRLKGTQQFTDSNDGLFAHKNVQDILDENPDARLYATPPEDNSPVFKYDATKSMAENAKAAMEFQQTYERQQEKERLEALNESRLTPEEIAKRERDIEDQYPLVSALYEENQKQVAAEQEEHNNKHAEISGRFDQAEKEHASISSELLDIQDQIESLEENEPDNKQAIAALKEKENELSRKEEEALDGLLDIEDELKEHGPKHGLLPDWNRLKGAAKDVYLNNLTTGKKSAEEHRAEHRKAARALFEYINETSGRHNGYRQQKLTPDQKRIVNNYEDNREDAHRIFGVVFPRWDRLSKEAKDAFLKSIIDHSGRDYDKAFYALGIQLINEKKNLTDTQRQAEFDNINKYKRAAAAISEKNQAEYERLRERAARSTSPITPYVVQKAAVSKGIVSMIEDNNINGVLKSLKEEPLSGKSSLDDVTIKMNKLVAELLGKLQLATQIKFAEKGELSNDVLGKYDPKTDTIIYQKDGLTKSTILHEIVHAATVKIIYLAKSGQTALLSAQQILAVKRLEEIMNQTKELLGDSYPKAYKNLYEFVAYAMTSKAFQDELHNYAPSIYHNELFASELGTKPAERIESIAGSMWTAFTKAVAKALGVTKGNIGKSTRANYLLEVSSAFEQILSVPQKGMDISETLNATKQPSKSKVVTNGITKDSILDDNNPRYKEKNVVPKTLAQKILYNFSYEGMKNIATNFVNERYEAKVVQDQWDAVDKIIRNTQKNYNNFYDYLCTSASQARNYFVKYLSDASNEADVAVADFANSLGISVDVARERLHKIAEMFAEKERRHIKWLLFQPLRTDNVLNNGTLSPADRRVQLMGDRSKGIPGIVDMVALTPSQQKQIRAELEMLNKNYGDPAGYGGIYKNQGIDEKSDQYNAVGLSVNDVAAREKEYNHPDNAKMKQGAERVFAAMKKITDATKELNIISNFWSFPVSNITGIYDYQHYLPFKGVPKHAQQDMALDPNMRGKGRDFQEVVQQAKGRTSVADDPILQAMVDSVKAAGKAGRANLTQALKNALPYDKKYNPEGTGIIKGEIKKHIPFAERETVDLSEFKGGRNIFHYNKDGSIDVLAIQEGKVLDAVRRTYSETNPMVDLANRITGFFGKQHTRYNFQFAPLNFTRDALTNAFFIGAKYGPKAAAGFVKEMTNQIVVHNGMPKAAEIAFLHERGDALSQKKLDNYSNKKHPSYDPYKAAMIEYINNGGKTTYLYGFTLKSQLDELNKQVGRSGIVRNKEQFEKLIDTWTDMFEFASRAAAYKILKDKAYQQAIKENNSEEVANQIAIAKAVAETKNLANFEQVGKYGKSLGALYMFIRPSATGALTAIEAAAPAFVSLETALQRQPKEIQENQQLRDKFIAQYKDRQRNAQYMIGGLMGAGMATYFMAAMMAPDDEWRRNAVKSDNMQQWTRFARFHFPGTDTVFQVPWGFGLGAFAAAGAQVAATLSGAQPVGDMLANIFLQISLDSFIPIPVSKMPPTEMPLEFLLDSIAPSVARPLLEFALNKNGLGQSIYNDQNRRFGDAFTGGDKTPEIYKTISRELAVHSGGSIDWGPNTLYFLANSYLDGVSRVGEFGYGAFNITQGRKDFNPKSDLPLFGSFFGAKSNVDSREFSKVQKQIEDMEGKLKEFKAASPQGYMNYMEKNPFAEIIVDSYNKELNNSLNPIRQMAKLTRNNTGMNPRDRDAQVKILTQQENLIKHSLVEMFKAYGVKP
jgi:hypothetical protein